MRTLKPDIRRIATRFGVDPWLIQAIDRAEGNLLKAVQCSLPKTKTREQAIEITCRTVVHAMSDYIIAEHREPFVDFFAARWAPVGVANDPQGLNAYFPRNVREGWIQRT
jgi:hypothetical protein